MLILLVFLLAIVLLGVGVAVKGLLWLLIIAILLIILGSVLGHRSGRF